MLFPLSGKVGIQRLLLLVIISYVFQLESLTGFDWDARLVSVVVLLGGAVDYHYWRRLLDGLNAREGDLCLISLVVVGG